MPQSTKREGFVLGPKGRLRSAAKQEPPTVGETPCLYDNKKEQSMTAQILLAEREVTLAEGEETTLRRYLMNWFPDIYANL